eukprot:snap_masked-scaffold1515_size37859-processed-gene-0.4 protein:Tk12714 transcript:snap_masked-scaffold1515_size37859-processed-gene-0.4-mRNA-1 annotation:"ras guanine nucleotide exchange factor b-like"
MSSSSEEALATGPRPTRRRLKRARSHSLSATPSAVKRSKGSSPRACQLCQAYESIAGDHLLQGEGLRAHHFCLLFSSGLGQKGAEDEGLRGFLPQDVAREIRRGSRLKCAYCKKKGATVGCARSTCKKSYHLPCGSRNKSVQQFFDQFKSFCSTHRPVQKVSRPAHPSPTQLQECGLCSAGVDGQPTFHVLWTPCCGRWLHRDCLQPAVITGGTGFKCPLCLDESVFVREMRVLGIHFPVNALKQRPLPDAEPAIRILGLQSRSCRAKVCICPRGRTEAGSEGSEWSLTPCSACPERGIHEACGGLTVYENPRWFCYTCRMIVREEPDSTRRTFQFPWGTASGMRAGHAFRTSAELKAELESAIQSWTSSQTLALVESQLGEAKIGTSRGEPSKVTSSQETQALRPEITVTYEDHMNLTLEDLIIRGLNREYNHPNTYKSTILTGNALADPAQEGSSSSASSSSPNSPTNKESPGDSDYESSQEAQPQPSSTSSAPSAVPQNSRRLTEMVMPPTFDAKIHATIKDFFRQSEEGT